jgi:ribonuclease Z
VPRRIVPSLVFLIIVVLAAGSIAFWRLGGMDGVQQLAIRRILQDQQAGLFEDGRLHVFTLGTGSPQLGGGRMPVANAIIAGDEFLVLDAGEGASRTMGELGLPVQRITGVFITHWHSDHFAGLGQILNQSWNADRNHEVQVHGPTGVEQVMGGLHQMYRDDIRYRSLGEVEHNDPAYALGAPVTVSIPDGAPGTVAFDRNGVVVRAFHVDHGHVKPAYGYRVEYNGRSVVFSGDTVASPLVAAAAQDCDLLIHEALNLRLMGNAVAALRDLGNEVDAQRAWGVMRYHADTLGVARVAAEANAAKLVLSHIIPASTNPLLNRLFVSGMAEHYAGPIVVAKDGQHFAL